LFLIVFYLLKTVIDYFVGLTGWGFHIRIKDYQLIVILSLIDYILLLIVWLWYIN